MKTRKGEYYLYQNCEECGRAKAPPKEFTSRKAYDLAEVKQEKWLCLNCRGIEIAPTGGLIKCPQCKKRHYFVSGCQGGEVMKWEDTTNYRRGQEHIPTCWSIKIGRLKVSVLSSHIYYPGQWVMHCSPFFDTHKLDVETKEEAQVKALELVGKEAAAIVADLAAVAQAPQEMK